MTSNKRMTLLGRALNADRTTSEVELESGERAVLERDGDQEGTFWLHLYDPGSSESTEKMLVVAPGATMPASYPSQLPFLSEFHCTVHFADEAIVMAYWSLNSVMDTVGRIKAAFGEVASLKQFEDLAAGRVEPTLNNIMMAMGSLSSEVRERLISAWKSLQATGDQLQRLDQAVDAVIGQLTSDAWIVGKEESLDLPYSTRKISLSRDGKQATVSRGGMFGLGAVILDLRQSEPT